MLRVAVYVHTIHGWVKIFRNYFNMHMHVKNWNLRTRLSDERSPLLIYQTTVVASVFIKPYLSYTIIQRTSYITYIYVTAVSTILTFKFRAFLYMNKQSHFYGV